MNSARRQFLYEAAGLVAGAALTSRDAGAQPAVAAQSEDSPIASVRDLGEQFLNNTVNVTGADGATSIVLPSGDALWVFGDTVEGPFETIRGLKLAGLRSNTAAIVPRQDASSGLKQFHFLATPDGKRPRQLIPFAPDEDPAQRRVWGIHGACVGDDVYLFNHRITLLADVDVFVNFKLDGMGISRAKVGELEFSRLVAPDGTHQFWKGDAPTFGVFAEQRDGYLYLWGSLATGMYLARTRPDSIADLTSYEYLVEAPTMAKHDTKPRWASKFAPSAALFDSVPNEMSASYNPYLKRHVAFHALQREHKVVMRTAPQITGSWGPPQVAFVAPKIKADDLVYAAKEHPELARDGGRVVYVTYVNSSTYVPRLVELTLK